MTWTSATNGFGPVERDDAVSDVRLTLGGACSTFTAKVGVDDEVGNSGSVIFEVFTDGSKVDDSGVMTGSTATKSVNVNVNYDHADWADAHVTC